MTDVYVVDGVRTPLGRMEREQASRGLATLCVGVGQGAALAVEAA
jgi:acetyl-CoA acetyltransferase